MLERMILSKFYIPFSINQLFITIGAICIYRDNDFKQMF